MKRVIVANCPGVNVVGEATPNSSGAFEVTNVDTKKVYHSKASGGGYLDNNKEKLIAVVAEIKKDSQA